MYLDGKYEAVIGLEVHAQMNTASKAFCSCPTEFNALPNTNTCPVCLGHPGTLPVLNENLVEFILKLGLSVNCKIADYCIFARKNYFYPDLPKGYQISQYDKPICTNGFIEVKGKKIGITRIHMEEDAGKSIHELHKDETIIDLNRCGIPLVEIVSEPDMRTPEDAYDYLTKLKQLVQYLDICDANMEEGSLRCDANISVRLRGTNLLGTKTEVKNLNSFRNVQDAIECEINRQIDVIENSGIVEHATLTYDAKKKRTTSTRSKEEAHDYRYFPEPDLVTVHITEDRIKEIRKLIPELPDTRKKRFISSYFLPEYDADILTQDPAIADYFEKACINLKSNNYKGVSNWIMTEILRILKDEKIRINEFKIKPENISSLIDMVSSKKITNNLAKDVFRDMINGKIQDPEKIVKDKNLTQLTDIKEIELLVYKILDENPEEKQRYLNGETKLSGFFVGKVIKESKGKANPKIINDILDNFKS